MKSEELRFTTQLHIILKQLCPSTLKMVKGCSALAQWHPNPFYVQCWFSRTMWKTDKPLKVSLCMAICILLMCRHQTSLFHPVHRVGSGLLWFFWDATFMWKQSLGPFSPTVVTEDNEIHNICHLLTLFGVTDLLLIRGLPTRVQLHSWNEADGSHGLSGAAVTGMNPGFPLLRPETQSLRHFDRCNHYH